jgi:putative spermidine/putrescine transport system permease protein
MKRALLLLNLVTFLYLLGPIVVIVGSAFGTTGYLAFPPHGFTLRWFAAAFADRRYLDAFATSLVVAVAATALSLAVGMTAAYALARGEFPGRRALAAVLMLPLTLPSLVLAIALTILFSTIGFTAGSARLVVAHAVLCTPYVIRVTIPVLARVDATLEEAAQNLGAGRLATFLLVTLPAIRPGAIAAATLAFIVSFDEIELAIFLADPRAPTLPVRIYSAVQLGIDPSVGAVSALLVLMAMAAMGFYQLLLARRPT